MGSTIRGWRAAAARAGTAPTTLRRAVERGQIVTRQIDGTHLFDAEALDALRHLSADRDRSTLRQREAIKGAEAPIRDATNDETGDTLERPVVGDIGDIARADHREISGSATADDSGTTNEEVRGVLVAAALERAKTEKLMAEVERLRTQRVRDDLVRVQREEQRASKIDAVVARWLAALPDAERTHVEQPIRLSLAGALDLDNHLEVAAAVASALRDLRSRHEAARLAAEQRAAQQRRADRVRQLVTDLSDELRVLGYSPSAIELAARAARHELDQLDNGVLSGAVWPSFVARMYASVALGVQPPAPPMMWHPPIGWWPAQPGD